MIIIRQVQDKNKMGKYSAPTTMPTEIKECLIETIKRIKEIPNDIKEKAFIIINDYDNLSNDIREKFFNKFLSPIIEAEEKAFYKREAMVHDIIEMII